MGIRNFQSAQAAAREFSASWLHLDLADKKSITLAAREACRIDAPVNNAGILCSGDLIDDPEDCATSMAIMLCRPDLLMHDLTR